MTSRTNSFRRKEKEKQEKPKKKGFKGFSFKGDGKIIRVLGIVLLSLSLFMFLSFTSFIFSWDSDYSVIREMSWETISAAGPDTVKNLMGTIGAWIGYVFIYRWFGVASYLFLPIIFLAGYKLLYKVNLLPFLRTFSICTFTLIWLSLTFGFIFSGKWDILGGSFGYHAQNWLQGTIGIPGTLLLLTASMLSFLVFSFNIHIPEFNFFKPKYKEEKTSSNEAAVLNPNEAKLEGLFDHELFNGNGHKETEEEEEEFDPEQLTIKDTDEQPAIPISMTPSVPPAAHLTHIPASSEGEIDLEIEQVHENDDAADDVSFEKDEYDPTLDLSNYKFPGIDLLSEYENEKRQINPAELEERKNLIVETLKNYNIEIEKIKAAVGPTVTLYEIIPAPGVRISKIKNLEDDIALSLAALGIRIIAPIPGKGTIGIEVPNLHPEMVSIRSVIASQKFQKADMDLPIVMGKTILNEVYVTDLAKMPHLLMAGATGQGKSVGLNVILTSLLYCKHPSQIKFVLVDPKKVELSLFKKIEKHFLAKLPDNEEAIITDTKLVVNTLASLCIEMDNRYDLLKEAGVRNIKEYNKKFLARRLNPVKGHYYMPYIVLVIDELADLMMTAGKEVEMPIARLAQLARAIGIHLILATQRPSVNIITGTIKANFPARLAFRVTSKIDSRTILDSGGAEQLVGRGDMLLSTGGEIIRLQCPFVDTDEVDRLTEYIQGQQSYPEVYALPEVKEEGSDSLSGEMNEEDYDPLFEDAARVIVQNQQGSTSLIQRRMKLGYNRAGRLMDQLEYAGIVGPNEGSKARSVLIPDEYALEQFLTNMKKTSR